MKNIIQIRHFNTNALTGHFDYMLQAAFLAHYMECYHGPDNQIIIVSFSALFYCLFAFCLCLPSSPSLPSNHILETFIFLLSSSASPRLPLSSLHQITAAQRWTCQQRGLNPARTPSVSGAAPSPA